MKNLLKKILNYASYAFFVYVLIELYKSDLDGLEKAVSFEAVYFFYGLIFLVTQNLLTGLTWSVYVKKEYSIDFNTAFVEWLNSYKAKYVPGKITSPIIRIQHELFDKLRKDLYFTIFIEQVYLVGCNFFIGGYLFLNNTYNFTTHIFIFLLVKLVLYFFRNLKIKSFSFIYFKYISLIQFSGLFNLIGLYNIAKMFGSNNAFEIALLYQFVHSISVVISIVPAGIGIREVGIIELSKTIGIKTFSIELIAVVYRLISVFCDLVVITLSIFANTVKKFNNNQ